MKRVREFLERNWQVCLIAILLSNFALRLLIYFQTVLFNFSDYNAYLAGIDIIHNEGSISLMIGNFLYAISYLGYYAKYLLGSITWFYVMNCFLGTMTTFIMAKLVIRLSGSVISGVFTALILTFYTEFMVFSSVFYTPVIMFFLLSLLIWFLYLYYRTYSLSGSRLKIGLIVIVFFTAFLFKPELIFLPVFLISLSVFFIKKDQVFFKRTIFLSLVLTTGTVLFLFTGAFSRPKDQPIANDFIFFGHTDYGGDGGEGSFIYPENEIRYKKALSEWCKTNNIDQPGRKEINRFQWDEVIKYITHSPFSWIKLQFTKFFRTFGAVPESTSFMVLYTGLLKGNLWLTSIVVVAPVALIILLFITLFNFASLKKLLSSPPVKPLNVLPKTSHLTPQTNTQKHFIYVYLLLFFYYLIATVFFGQYQGRYRIPLMVVFIIPILGYFIAKFDRKQFLNRISLSIKCAFILLFMTIWVFQAKKAISNKARFDNAIESVKGEIKDKR